MSSSSPLGFADFQEAGVDELLNSMKDQVLLLVQWAKRIPPFMLLGVDDQICLLKAHASEHLLLGVTRRSRNQNYLLLGNSYIVTRQSPENSFALIASRVLDQLTIAFRTINVDDTEYACLKAIVFFDPYADGLQAREAVFNVRQEVIMALYSYLREKCVTDCDEMKLQFREHSSASNPHSRSSSPGASFVANISPEFAIVKRYCPISWFFYYYQNELFNFKFRFGELLLMVPSVRSIAEDMVDHIKFYKLFGAAKVDNVLHELLLGDTASDDNLQPSEHGDNGANQNNGQANNPSSSSNHGGAGTSTSNNNTSSHSQRPYPNSGPATPVLCNGSYGGGATMMSQAQYHDLSPANNTNQNQSSYDQQHQPTPSSFVPSYGPLEPCLHPQLNIMTTPQSLHHTSSMSSSPGLTALAAAALAASSSAQCAMLSTFSTSDGFLSPPTDSSYVENAESPSILSCVFSDRPATSSTAPSGSSSSSSMSAANRTRPNSRESIHSPSANHHPHHHHPHHHQLHTAVKQDTN